MDQSILTYLMDQATGVIIAVILIFRVETKLDALIKSIENYTREVLVAIKEEKGTKGDGDDDSGSKAA